MDVGMTKGRLGHLGFEVKGSGKSNFIPSRESFGDDSVVSNAEP